MNLSKFREHAWWFLLAAVAIGFLPLLIPFFRGQWARSEYQAFPLLLAAIGFFFITRWDTARLIERHHWGWQTLGWLTTLVALGLLGLAMFFFSPWLAIVSFVFFSFSVTISIWQHWDVRGIFLIWMLTWLLVPPPLDRDKMFVAKLQLFSSDLTSRILDGLTINHVLEGNIFKLATSPPKSLFVDEACSGIVSLVSIITCIAIYAVWQRRSFFHLFLLLGFGFVWTILMNSIRLSLIAWFWDRFQVDLSSGQPHLLLGMGVFLLSAGIVFLVDQLLTELLAPIETDWRERDRSSDQSGLVLMKIWNALIANRPSEEQESDSIPAANQTQQQHQQQQQLRRNRVLATGSPVGWPVLLILSMAGLAQISVVAPSEAKLQSAIRSAMARAVAIDRDFDPVGELELTKINFQTDERDKFDAWGEYSRSFYYQDNDQTTYWVSIDFPFGPHWHDLRDCYKGAGWKIEEETWFKMEIELDSTSAPRLGTSWLESGWEADQFLTTKPNVAETQLVVHSAFYADGKIFNRPRAGSLFYDFVTHVAKGRDRQEQADYFQIQVVVSHNKMVTPEQEKKARDLITIVSQRFRESVAEFDRARE